MKIRKPRRPNGRWIYYILHDGILWPCPVRWEWESGYGGWLPFYFSPTLEFVVGDPAKAWRVPGSGNRSARRQRWAEAA
ncbi:hypothetical protein ACFSFZ_04720 [Mixta tenebrionis]|uniref:Uncharacterized protein n=1 Tax=Mixta tenebrionis TaxID=2562439 RepID=A0A506V7E6_9GAMM|nr:MULTISPECIES: hypothetical protein [Mixta]QHM76431.1 hypothetical protein C7M52_02407 [Mixta theicola]TPW41389.1 hypothetical protein FKM52_14155 [Mixta tenebrionis]